MFTVTANAASFQNLGLINTSGNPSAGAGISTQGVNLKQKVDYHNLSVCGFWINIDVQVGAEWTANNIYILSPKKYGLKIQNTIDEDGGDWSIVNSNFYAGDYSADAAIQIESSGGGKINNIKINTGYPSTHNFVEVFMWIIPRISS